MPRVYKCKSCGIVHEPPTGKHCQNRDNIQQPTDNQAPDIMPILMDIQQRLQAVEMDRSSELGPSRETVSRDDEEVPDEEDDNSDSELSASGESDDDTATPETLRRDTALMKRAAARLKRMRRSLREADELCDGHSFKAKGKRSGSVMTATDKVVKTVDWPHMFVRRNVGGRRKGVTFSELKVEEFVFGFLTMLEAPKCKMPHKTMMKVLRDIMQDAMDFSWQGARGLYENIGIEVETGMMEWTDEEGIKKKREEFAHTFDNSRKEIREPQAKPALLPAPPSMKCCMPFL